MANDETFLHNIRVELAGMARAAGFLKVYPYGFQKDDKEEIRQLLVAEVAGGKKIISGGDIVCASDEEREFEPKVRVKVLFTLHIRLNYSDPENFEAERTFEAMRRTLADKVRFSTVIFPKPPKEDEMQDEGQVIRFGSISSDLVGGDRWWSAVGTVRVVQEIIR